MKPRKRQTRLITPALLRRMPLPGLDHDDDKESRGRVLVIGGSRQVPGAVLLAGVASLRAGAGKLQLATVRDAAIGLGIAVPEALVVSLPSRRNGEIDGARAIGALLPHVSDADAVLVGPGMYESASVRALIAALIPKLGKHAVLVLDGAAIPALRGGRKLLAPLAGRAILTPHAGEMASLLGVGRREVASEASELAQQTARDHGATIVLKGAESWIADADGSLFCFRGAMAGLGTSGSGDTLAGIIAGLCGRGASPCTASAWGVWAHGEAGRRLTRRFGTVGFLARELLAEVPALAGRQ